MRPRGRGAFAGSIPGASGDAILLAAVAVVAFFALTASVSAFSSHVYDGPVSTAFGSVPGAIGVALDQSDGAVYVAVSGTNTVQKYDASGSPVTAFGASGVLDGSTTPSGSFSVPYGLAVDQTSHDLYVADLSHGFVDKFDSSGAPIAAFGVNGQLGSGDPGSFQPGGLAVDPADGSLYVTDFLSGTVQKYDSSGAPVAAFGSGGQISVPGANGLAVDSTGRLYVSTQGQAFSFDSSGNAIATVDDGSNGAVLGVGVDPSDDDLYAMENNQIAQFDDTGALVTRFGAGKIASAYGIAVNETSGKIYAGDNAAGAVAAFGSLVTLPDTTTEAATGLTRTSATLNATVNADGGGSAACRFDYITDAAFSSEGGYGAGTATAPCSVDPVTGSSDTAVTTAPDPLTGLSAGTTYHFRVVANNGTGGDQDGADQTFTTPPAVTDLSAEPATNLTGTSAAIHGSWTNDGGDTHYYFEWGIDTSYGSTSAVPPGVDAGSAPGTQTKSFDVGGLSPTTTYHYRIVATNSFGTTFSPDQTFETLTFPAIGARAATKVTTTTATINAAVNPENAGATTYHFEYGTDASYGTSTSESVSIGSDNTDHLVSLDLTNLSPGVTYHFRVVATSPAGVTEGADQSFIAVYLAPTVDATSFSGVGAGTATLAAQIKPGFGPTLYMFEYGETTAYGLTTSPAGPIGSDNTDHSVGATLTGLSAGTTYHFRVVAINFAAVTHGPDLTFTTPGVPSIGSISASHVTTDGAALDAQVNPSLAATTYHFEYGTDASYGTSTPESAPIGSDGNSHAVGATLNGLAPGTTYHYRIVAVNSIGSAASRDETFTTAPAQVVTPPTTVCRRGFVKKQGKCVKKKRHHKRHHKAGRRHG